jgi:hypothetical protein
MLNILLSLRLHQPTHRRVGTGRVLPLFAITGWLRISGMRWVRISGTHSRGQQDEKQPIVKVYRLQTK